MCKLTIFTATFNRGHLISQLYNSLLRQSSFDFEWLVIDDGSQDNTSDLFKNWIHDNPPFKIRYYYQKNKGLIRALNRGVELAKGKYFAKIDSDDYVTDDYIKKIKKWILTIKNRTDIYAVSGVKVDHNGQPLKKVWPQIPSSPGYIDATDLERKLYQLNADMSEAWETKILQKHPFFVWKDEKFAPEQIVFFEIALSGKKIRWFRDPICICEYQQDGLTKSSNKLVKENPMGYAMMYNQNLLIYTSFLNRLRNSMQMTALCFYAHHLDYLKQSNNMLATLLSFPLGIALGFRRKLQFSKIK